ncbi:glycosyltransferase family 2 protein [Bacillus sp. AFS017336]|uniref:glycosyltransferase family 2 protein n=1 Tax=Bacillus sp. AFS017336 TaxID=2033489 RepID=UPI000BF13AC5|nr:glycosyltransferase family 2 protein [Bacillus sp. AFS017336]PEL13554.1 glycosyl transferase [Bacillus sp. AFS017336]
MDEKLVSIILPTHNSENYIQLTVNSILNQVYQNFELIVIDDCSTDNTVKIIEKYISMDNRITLIKLEKNLGAAKARNIGLEKSTGRYIAYIDADDLWEPNKLETQIDFMRNNNIGFCFTSYYVINSIGEKLKIIKMPNTINYNRYLKNTIIQTCTVMVDTTLVEKSNLVMPDLRRGQDAATWLKILKSNVLGYGMEKVLASYRRTPGSLSSNKFKAIRRTWFIYRNIEKLGIIKSTICFISYAFNALRKRIYINSVKY